MARHSLRAAAGLPGAAVAVSEAEAWAWMGGGKRMQRRRRGSPMLRHGTCAVVDCTGQRRLGHCSRERSEMAPPLHTFKPAAGQKKRAR